MDVLGCEATSSAPSPVIPNAHTRLAPRPRTVAETGLSDIFLSDLVAKHLYEAGVLDLRQLSERTALAGPILETVLGFLRDEAGVEVRGRSSHNAGLRYALTDRGRAAALDALMRSGYVGPAPVPLRDYERVVHAQSVHTSTITQQAMHTAFADMVIRETLLHQLGPAVHSGRAIFVYGSSGTGKSYISRRLARLLGENVLIPYALGLGETVIQFFDPMLHHAASEARAEPSAMLEHGHDPRFALCQRPVAITGGELTLDMLEVRYEPATKQYHAPLQLKASNGMFVIDDLGRQRLATVDLLNRWIVPMEERRDFLNLGTGKHFEVPFDVVLIFCTNMNPLELADEAFLRRLGYKIRFDYLEPIEYEKIWRQVCSEQGISFDPGVLRYVLEELHAKRNVPLLPCHPRDLLTLAQDQCRYQEEPNSVTAERMRWAWDNYFVKLA
ncbi:MAG: AAA family ATPase [Acidiferrobacterales bacterium]